MAEAKTKENDADAWIFLAGVVHAARRADALAAARLMAETTGQPPRMWGENIVGFGKYSYRQRDGSKATWPLVALSPRKANLVIYIMPGFSKLDRLLENLGPHKRSVSCLYLTNLARNDMAVLGEIIRQSYEWMIEKYGTSH